MTGVVKYDHRSDRLLLDYDAHPPMFPALQKKLRELKLHPLAISWERSHQSKHWHGVIWLQESLTVTGCFFAQLYCGSDPQRERWNFVRSEIYKRDDRLVQVLFERKL